MVSKCSDIVIHHFFPGLRVIPEFDQPAHVGNGWNYPGAEGYTVCVNVEPWYDYCVEPPCGQLNPGNQEIYDRLQEIYKEFFEMFEDNTFHMGADEVGFKRFIDPLSRPTFMFGIVISI